MNQDSSSSAERFQLADRAVPERLHKAAVAVVRTGSTVFGHGSGTLLRIADCSFVVTARHVIADAVEKHWPLGITGATHIVETPGNWLGSPQTGNQPDRGLGDIAVYKLSDGQVAELGEKEFVRLPDLGLRAELTGGSFSFLGFPVMWSEQTSTPQEPLGLGLFRYSTIAAQDTGRLVHFDPDVHFLLGAEENTLVNQDGQSTSLRTRNGTRVNLVDGVGGISGSGVWRIGQVGAKPEMWRQEQARLVGIVTGVYPAAQFIKATKWVFVMKLIHEGFPEVRPALKLLALQGA